jgi:hypothetical protein
MSDPSKSPYRFLSSGLIQHGETLFPFNSFGVKVDWNGVLKWLNNHEWEGDDVSFVVSKDI